MQLHGANGYLIDQFLRDGTNHRDDDYGGSPENRIRFMRESVARVADAIGAGRTGIRLSPNGETQGADDSDPASVFVPAAAALDALGIAFLELREQGPDGTFGKSDVPKLSPEIRKVFKGPLVLNQDYDGAGAQADLDSGVADAIAFGRKYIANPIWSNACARARRSTRTTRRPGIARAARATPTIPRWKRRTRNPPAPPPVAPGEGYRPQPIIFLRSAGASAARRAHRRPRSAPGPCAGRRCRSRSPRPSSAARARRSRTP